MPPATLADLAESLGVDVSAMSEEAQEAALSAVLDATPEPATPLDGEAAQQEESQEEAAAADEGGEAADVSAAPDAAATAAASEAPTATVRNTLRCYGQIRGKARWRRARAACAACAAC
jgi:hypothetical protein